MTNKIMEKVLNKLLFIHYHYCPLKMDKVKN